MLTHSNMAGTSMSNIYGNNLNRASRADMFSDWEGLHLFIWAVLHFVPVRHL